MKRRTFFRSLAALAGLGAVKPLALLARNKATSKYAKWEYETKWMAWDSGYEMPHYYRIYRKSPDWANFYLGPMNLVPEDLTVTASDLEE